MLAVWRGETFNEGEISAAERQISAETKCTKFAAVRSRCGITSGAFEQCAERCAGRNRRAQRVVHAVSRVFRQAYGAFIAGDYVEKKKWAGMSISALERRGADGDRNGCSASARGKGEQDLAK